MSKKKNDIALKSSEISGANKAIAIYVSFQIRHFISSKERLLNELKLSDERSAISDVRDMDFVKKIT